MWRNVHGHAIYQIIVLIVVIFGLQGSLVAKYDVKCLLPRGDNGIGQCPPAGLNPFYTADHYFMKNSETAKYWTNLNGENKIQPDAFEPNAWA